MSHSNVVDLPHPSLVIESPDLLVKAGAKVIVTLNNSDKKVIGHLESFSPNRPVVTLSVEDDLRHESIPLSEIKILTFPEERLWQTRKSPLGDTGDNVLLPPKTQHFEVKFKDGTRVEGETLGYLPDQSGIHLFPTTGKDRFVQTFSSNEAIESYRVGDYLGEMLVKDHLVSKHDLDKVIDEQTSKRKLPLGEYLLSKSVVSSDELKKALSHQKTMPNLRLGEILVSEGLVSDEDLEKALASQTEDRKRPLGAILIERGLVEQAAIQRCLVKKLGIPFINLKEFQVSPVAVSRISMEVARSLSVMPVAIVDTRLVVAMSNPMDREAIETLRFNSNMLIEPVMADDDSITRAIDFYYSAVMETNFEELEDEEDDDITIMLDEREQVVADNVVVKIVNKIIIDAYNQGASDIHIEPYPGNGKTIVRFRKDGTLVEYAKLPSQYKNALISRIKIMSKLDIAERRKSQDGKIDFKNFGNLKIELRVVTVPTAAGLEDAILRILAAGKPVPINGLNLSKDNLGRVQDIISKPYGMFFVCGPTGSGKTTTLHSILGFINTPERKIWTAEDPVEITQRGLRQVQINPKAGVTFASAMRSFLRADPDVIMVGEMRDKETARIGIEASLTGHLVLSTLHTNNAPESIIRLLDMDMDPFNFSDALLGILAQRLAKRLCPVCKQAYHPDEDEIQLLLMEYCQDLGRDDEREAVQSQMMAQWHEKYVDEQGQFTLYKAVGCSDCDHTGYRGRVGLHELLIASDNIKRAIITKMPMVDLTHLAISEGMRTLRQDGIDKVLQGLTDISRVRAVCIK